LESNEPTFQEWHTSLQHSFDNRGFIGLVKILKGMGWLSRMLRTAGSARTASNAFINVLTKMICRRSATVSLSSSLSMLSEAE
jgi:hypothetical protein